MAFIYNRSVGLTILGGYKYALLYPFTPNVLSGLSLLQVGSVATSVKIVAKF